MDMGTERGGVAEVQFDSFVCIQVGAHIYACGKYPKISADGGFLLLLGFAYSSRGY